MSNVKRSWPLFLLAGCSFIPVFGFFFGAAAVSWGLLSDRPHAVRAVAIDAAGAFLNLVGGVLLLWNLQQDPIYASASAARSRKDLMKLVAAIEDYRETTGRYPQRLSVFTTFPYSPTLVNTRDFSVGLFRLPRDYHYQLASDGLTYTLFGVGPDAEPDTDDDVYPELPDSVVERSGFRLP